MVRLRFETDLATSLKASTDLNKAVEKIGTTLGKTAGEAKKLELAAKRIVDQNLSPQEKYNQKLETMARAVKSGSLSFEQASHTAGRLRQKLDEVGKSQTAVFGANAIASLQSYLLSFAGISAVTTLMANYKAELDKISGEFAGGLPKMGQLAQLAIQEKDPKAALKRMFAESEGFQTTGAVTSLPAATDLLFSLLSANVGKKDRAKIAELLKFGAIESGTEMAQSLAAMKLAFPEVSARQMLAMGVIAAAPSPGTAGGLVQQAGKLSAQFKSLGWGPGAALSSTSILGAAFGGAEFGRERAEQMAKQIEHYGFQKDPSLRGKSIFEVLEKVGAGGLSQERLRPYLGGRMEAIQGFRTLYQNRELLKRLTTAAESGDMNTLDSMVELLKGVPQIGATAEANAAAGRRAVSRPVTTTQLLRSLRDEMAAGRGPIGTGVVDFGSYLLQNWLPESAGINELRTQSTNPNLRDQFSPELLEQIRKHLESMDNKTNPAIKPPKPNGRAE